MVYDLYRSTRGCGIEEKKEEKTDDEVSGIIKEVANSSKGTREPTSETKGLLSESAQ